MYIATDETGRIGASTPHERFAQGMEFFEFPENFDFDKQIDYRIVEGELIYDPILPPAADPEEMKKKMRLSQMEGAISLFVKTAKLSDEQAYAVSAYYDDWNEAAHYEADDIVMYKAKLYRCRDAHDAQTAWNPEDSHSLWGEILFPGEVRDWQPPQPGMFDGYNKGDKVIYNDKTWISTFEGLNIWAPGVYGWEEVTEE